MRSIINYVKNETRTFKEFPLNDVDALIFSAISYYNFENIVPSLFSKGKIAIKDIDLTKINDYIKCLHDIKKYKELLPLLMNSPRFMDLKLDNYFEKKSIDKEMHFKVFTIENDDFMFVSYMGTNATLISWKEDFNMAYLCPVPSQKLAVKYLNKVMVETTKRIYVGGHSKGGNLAVYAATHTLLLNQVRIKNVYSFDGPGFTEKFFKSIKYNLIKKKIRKIIPAGSIVGMLYYTKEPQIVIKASGIGFNQHPVFNWNIKGSTLVYLDDRSWSSKHLDTTLTNWIDNLTNDQKKKFIDAIYDALVEENFDAKYIAERRFFKIYNSLRKGLKNLDPETRKLVIEVFKRLAYYEKQNLFKNKDNDK